jgi:four helix bundle protein
MTIRFEAYDIALQLIRSLRSPVASISRRDPDLARQLLRAGSSITLNLSEGNQRAGKDRLHLFRVALGSAAEVVASLETAEAWATSLRRRSPQRSRLPTAYARCSGGCRVEHRNRRRAPERPRRR